MSATRAQIATLLAKGSSVAEVARRTGLAYSTVSYHQRRLREDQPESAHPAADDPPTDGFLVPITTREDVRRLLRAGHSRAAVARELAISKGTVTYHARRFGMSVDSRAARRYDWRVIQRYYDAGHSVQECRALFGFSTASWSGAVRRGAVRARANERPIDELIKEGLIAARCGSCGIREWRGRPLALQLHHINGDRHDNRLENLALLCPNCHSQTDTWAGRNGNGRRGAVRRERRPTSAGGGSHHGGALGNYPRGNRVPGT